MAVVSASQAFVPTDYAKPIRIAKPASFKTNVLGQLGGWSETTTLQMAQYKTGCSFVHGMTDTHFCATPSETEWCTPFSAWEIINNEELSGIIGEESFDNGNLAKDACIQDDFCTGVAFAGKVEKNLMKSKKRIFQNFLFQEFFSVTFIRPLGVKWPESWSLDFP